MFGRVLNWLRSNPSEAPPRAAPTMAAAPAAEPLPPLRPPAEPGVRRRGPVFSSRAVRDAAVVTGAIETLRKFAAGTESVEDLDYRLAGLTKDQFAFLQISVGPELVQNCINRAAGGKGVKAASLRRTLNELAGIATPEPDRPVEADGDGSAGADSDDAPDAGDTDAGDADAEMPRSASDADSPGADNLPEPDAGTDLPAHASGETEAGQPGSDDPAPEKVTAAISGPDSPLPPVPEPPAVLPVPPLAAAAAAEEEVVPAPPHPRPAHEPALLPRLARAAADARRARLLDTLTDHLSASETSR
ncbi:hypothetical protein [Rhodocista pekingensis]|uniref:Uncharacterized protein n=1 Tax=Rhodocista pekingensis TaxID=201185 RepID=A0ABW2KTE9_9PROT